VGAGFIGPVHVEALRRLGINIRGILGCDPAESESAKRAQNLPRAYKDLDELLADKTVEAVHLCVPNVLQLRVCDAGAEGRQACHLRETAGDELRSVGRACGTRPLPEESRGRLYNIRFYPLNLQAREMVGRGELGQIYSVNGSYNAGLAPV